MNDIVQDLFRKLKPVYGDKIDNLRKVYLIEDRDGKADIESTLQILESKLLSQSLEHDTPLLPPPPEHIIHGPIEIGMVEYAGKKLYPFGLHLNELNSHVCITGATGRGKSNICFHIIKDLLRENLKWCLYDFKRSARDLLADEIPHNRKIQVFTVGRDVVPFKFNPLIPPPGIDPKSWIDKVVDIITKVQYAGFGVASLLRKAIDYVYNAVGMYGRGPLLKQPTLKDAFKYLKDYKPHAREINWMSSTIRSLEALSFGEMGHILNSSDPLDLKDILDMNVVFELDSLSNANRSFFIEALLTYFHAYRLSQGGDEQLKHVIIVEEAHRLLKKSDYQASTHDSILDTWITEARQLGEGLIILAQTPSILPAISLGNTYTSICLNLKHSADINTMAHVLLLPNDEKDCLGKLDLGKAIVKLQGRWLSPFLLHIPLYPIKKGSVSDEKLIQLMKPCSAYFRLKEAQNDPQSQFQASPLKDKYYNDNINTNDIIDTDDINKYENNNIKEIEKNILIDIIKNPGAGVVERYKRLGLSRRKGNKAKHALLKKNLVKEIPIITKKGRVVLLELTKYGRFSLKSWDIDTNTNQRTGGAVHEYWKEVVARYFESKGLKVIREMPVNGGKTVDLCVLNNGKKIAIEIETGHSDALWNIRKDLAAGFNQVVSVGVDEGVVEKLRAKVIASSLPREKVRLVVGGEYLGIVPT